MGGQYKDIAKRRANSTKHYQKNRDRLRADAREKYQREGWATLLWKKYRITEDQYWQLFARQGGVCAITGLPPEPGRRLDVDHDHKTGRVRGLLRTEVNKVLGTLQDDPALFRKAAAYLEH